MQNFNKEHLVGVIIKTAKNRLRYFDTTFNSVRKTLPEEVPLYIMADVPHERLMQYITTNDEIAVDSQENLYPNELVDWQDKIGFIENKTTVRGILGRYTAHFVNHKLQLYEWNNFVCREVTKLTGCKYIVLIEDDVVFKADWFTKVLELLKQPGFNDIGILSLFGNNRYADRLEVLELFTKFKKNIVPSQAFLINVEQFQKAIPEDFAFNIKCDFLDFPAIKKHSIKHPLHKYFKSGKLPTCKRDPFYNRNQDGWFISKLRKNSEVAFINKGVCQHIGVESAIYKNVTQKIPKGSILLKNFYTKDKKLNRVDVNIHPPYAL